MNVEITDKESWCRFTSLLFKGIHRRYVIRCNRKIAVAFIIGLTALILCVVGGVESYHYVGDDRVALIAGALAIIAIASCSIYTLCLMEQIKELVHVRGKLKNDMAFYDVKYVEDWIKRSCIYNAIIDGKVLEIVASYYLRGLAL